MEPTHRRPAVLSFTSYLKAASSITGWISSRNILCLAVHLYVFDVSLYFIGMESYMNVIIPKGIWKNEQFFYVSSDFSQHHHGR